MRACTLKNKAQELASVLQTLGKLHAKVSHRLVEPRAEKGEERFFRKLFTTMLAVHVEPATKSPHPPAGGVPDDGQCYLERWNLVYV